jgi:hypothetical protein
MKLDLPRPSDFAETEKGRSRPESAQRSECDKAVRQRWRALLLVIKAKLEAIEAGVSTFETEWLPYVVLPGGKTVAEHIGPQIAEGKIPSTLMLTTRRCSPSSSSPLRMRSSRRPTSTGFSGCSSGPCCRR